MVSRRTTRSVSENEVADALPMKILRMFARLGKSLTPQPQPISEMVKAGMGPKASASVLTIAAPVGVVSSASMGI